LTTNIIYVLEVKRNDKDESRVLKQGMHLKQKNRQLRHHHIERDTELNETGEFELRLLLNPDTDYQTMHSFKILVVPGWLTVLPPVLTCVIALTTQNVYVALFGGLLFGCLVLAQYNFYSAFTTALDTFVVRALSGQDRVRVIAFTLMMSAIAAMVQKAGGTLGVSLSLRKRATSRKKGAWFTYVTGSLMFFHGTCDGDASFCFN
jgi:hypothetical protein